MPLIFAFGIVNLPMLGWLAAAAAPILIHLWSRQKHRETSWAAMEYLLAAVRRQTRRLRLEQLLLLMIRTLIIVLLVLAVAEPFLERVGMASTSAGRTHRVLVIDGSYSMDYRPTDKSRFERAKELAGQIVQQGRQGDAATLVLMASPPRVVVGKPALEAGEMLEEIDNLKHPDTSADLPATLAAIRQVVQAAWSENPGLTRHEVYFLTDLQRVSWLPELSDAPSSYANTLADFRRFSEKLGALVVIDLGGPGAETFSYRFETPGDHIVEVAIPEDAAGGDALDVDNHRWMAVSVRQSIRVLCINGRPSGEPFGGATDWLFYALSPQSDDSVDVPAEQTLVQPEVATESALLERHLGQYDCVFLCEVAQFTSNEADVLDRYLGNGGNIVFFLGGQVLADRYNRELGSRAGGVRLLPARLGPIVEESAGGVDPREYHHPIVRPFRHREKAGLLTTQVLKYFKLDPVNGSKAKVVLATAGGDPLIVAEPLRRGRVVLVATSAADTSWTTMPIWSSFVPLVQEILAWCLAGQLQQRNVEVGQPISGSISTPAAATPADGVSLEVRGAGGADKKVRMHRDGDYSTWSYDDTLTAGIYNARFGSPIHRTQSYAVNVNTVESDLAHLGQDQLRNEVWPGIPFLYQTTWQTEERQPIGPVVGPRRLHVDMLYTVLGLLFLESFLARRFGHHTT
jgi:hypothetical protein